MTKGENVLAVAFRHGFTTISDDGEVLQCTTAQVIALIEDAAGKASAETSRADAAERERDELRKDRDSWKSHWEMYANAWKRELGGKLFNKRHLIDALVMTTEWLRENFEKWERETKAMKEFRRTHELAETLGVDPRTAFDPLPPEAEAEAEIEDEAA